MGGTATAKNVTERVGEMMGERLNAYDRMQLPITHLIRWKDAISWLKSELAGKGYLKGNSPHGIWEITPEGLAYLEKNLGEKIESRQPKGTADMETIRVGDVLISHKKNYHHVVELITGNMARILWLERVSGEPQKFYTYHRDVNTTAAPSYYDIIPSERVDRRQYRTPRGGWPD